MEIFQEWVGPACSCREMGDVEVRKSGNRTAGSRQQVEEKPAQCGRKLAPFERGDSLRSVSSELLQAEQALRFAAVDEVGALVVSQETFALA